MQPDPSSIEKPENLSHEMSSAPLPEPEIVQVEPVPAVESQVTHPQEPEKKRSKVKFASIALGFLIFLFFIAFAWVGYWAYQLSTELTNTQQQMSALQADYEKLQADYQALSDEKDKLAADLEKSSTDLKDTQSDLSKANQKSSDLSQKMSKARKLFEVVYVWISSDDPSDLFDINSQIEKSDDLNLINKWTALKKAPSDDAVAEFLDYLLKATRDSLK